jgi:hypothetical protein
MQVIDAPTRGFDAPSSSDLEAYRRVKWDSDNSVLEYADALDVELGSLRRKHVSTGLGSSDVAAVVLPNAQGTVKLIADGAISQFADVYGAYDGKVSATANGNKIGVALSAATADGDELEVLRLSGASQSSPADYVEIFDHFVNYTADDKWSLVTTTDGSVTLNDEKNGTVSITTAVVTADNEGAFIKSVAEVFKFEADKPIEFEAKVQFTEANADDANVLVGILDAVDADSMQDDGAGPPASYSGVVFFKVDGGTVWNCETSVGASQETTATTVTAGGPTFQTLRFIWQPISATSATVSFFIDGTLIATQTHTFTGGTEMEVALGGKDGSATNEETLKVDYVHVRQAL